MEQEPGTGTSELRSLIYYFYCGIMASSFLYFLCASGRGSHFDFDFTLSLYMAYLLPYLYHSNLFRYLMDVLVTLTRCLCLGKVWALGGGR